MKNSRLFFILSLSLMTVVLVGGLSALSAASGKLDWNKYDKYYDYEEKSPVLAAGVSILPVWSGSFNARFNPGGVYRVIFKSAFAGLAITSYVNNPVFIGWEYWAGMMAIGIVYDMIKSYDFVKVANKCYASLSVSPRIFCMNDAAGSESHMRKNGYEIEGLNLSAFYRF